MCITPNWTYTNKGSVPIKVIVPCRECWRCRSNRVNDYVARSLCEASTSDWVVSLTLTYRDSEERENDLAHKYITPQHFQDFVRSLRKRGHKIRYIAVGEYGTLKGRAHFHCILFGIGKKPDIPNKKNHDDPDGPWPHGYIFADWDGSERAIRYVCKYLQKGEPGEYWFTLSKKPALGSEFFKKRAEEYARNGVLPSSFNYLPPGGHKGRPYLLKGASRRDFIRHLLDAFGREGTINQKSVNAWVRYAIEKAFDYEWKREIDEMPRGHDVEQFEQEITARHLTDAQTKRQLVATANMQPDEDPEYGPSRTQTPPSPTRPRSARQYLGSREWHDPDDFA